MAVKTSLQKEVKALEAAYRELQVRADADHLEWVVIHSSINNKTAGKIIA